MKNLINKRTSILIITIFLAFQIKAQNEVFETTTVKTNLVGICAIDYADFDQDGDIDIGWGSEWTPTASPTGIHWLENTGENFAEWLSHSIDPEITGVMSVQVVDLNNDNLPDLLASAWGTHDVVWYENTGGDMENWTKHTLLSNFYQAHDAYADYINDDDLIDIVAAGAYQGKIKIMYNTGTDTAPEFNNNYNLCTNYPGVRTVKSYDFDMDGDKDILAASTDVGEFYWWRNDGGEQDWTRFSIDDDIDGYHNFSLVDFDYDGDMDFFAIGGNMLALYRNEGGNPIVWVREVLDSELELCSRVLSADFDLDADIDAYSITKIPGSVDLFSNNEGIPVEWDKQNIESNFYGGWGCQPIDFDEDGDLDIFACAGADNTIVFMENTTIEDVTDAPRALFRMNHSQICTGSGIEFINMSVGDIDEYTWDFGDDATPSEATGEGPHTVSFSSEGEKTISLTVTGANGTATYSETLNVTSSFGFNFLLDDFHINCRGDSIDIAVFGAESYSWSPEPQYLNSTQSVVRIKSMDTTTFTITGTIGSCSSDTSIIVTVNKRSNDDICDATMLEQGENGPFSNECSMVEEGEPVPPLTGCETQMSWCDDGGLQNSIWFKFVAPASGNVYISTSGIDNQLAIYEAESCGALLNGDYSLLAANDNSNGVSAAIDTLQGLTPGEIYWIQSDGNNGAEGEITITLNEIISINTINIHKSCEIYPNPATNYLHIKNWDAASYLKLIDVCGKEVLNCKLEQNKPVELKNLKGMYLVIISDDSGNQVTKKLLIE